jgi:uncharacterized protein YaiE (UPF0345 family)
MSYDFTELSKVVAGWKANEAKYDFQTIQPNDITMISGSTEMLKVSEDGFYVRGVKVPMDDREAETVYNAFKEFLVWSRLHRD